MKNKSYIKVQSNQLVQTSQFNESEVNNIMLADKQKSGVAGVLTPNYHGMLSHSMIEGKMENTTTNKSRKNGKKTVVVVQTEKSPNMENAPAQFPTELVSAINAHVGISSVNPTDKPENTAVFGLKEWKSASATIMAIADTKSRCEALLPYLPAIIERAVEDFNSCAVIAPAIHEFCKYKLYEPEFKTLRSYLIFKVTASKIEFKKLAEDYQKRVRAMEKHFTYLLSLATKDTTTPAVKKADHEKIIAIVDKGKVSDEGKLLVIKHIAEKWGYEFMSKSAGENAEK